MVVIVAVVVAVVVVTTVLVVATVEVVALHPGRTTPETSSKPARIIFTHSNCFTTLINLQM
jgi:hypothetical protein